MKKLIFYFSVLVLSTSLKAQINSKTKWGEVSKFEMDYNKVSFEKDAGAVILYEAGITSVYEGKNYNQRFHDRGRLLLSDNIVEKKIYRRIKILNESELSLAKQEIKYISYQGTQHIQNLKAQTINTDNGQIKIEKVEKKAIKETEVDNKNKIIEIQFPNVKVGSIIEFEYTIYDKRVHYIEGWKFQHNIPTLYSELKFNYDTQSVYKGVVKGELISKLVESRDQGSLTKEWSLNNIPSYKTLNYLYSPDSESEQIAFQLIQYHNYLVNLNFEKTTNLEGIDSWEKLGKSQNSTFQDIVKSQSKKHPENNGNLISLKNLVDTFKTTYHWNNSYSRNAFQSIKDLNQTKTGNSTELNLLLNSILVENGFNTQLVLISTRNNGKIVNQHPDLDQFNSTINLVTLNDNSTYLLDASNMNIELGYMPLENFNQYGFLFDNKESKFISLEPPLSDFNSTQNYVFKDGKLNLTRIDKFNGYFKVKTDGDKNLLLNSFQKLPEEKQGTIVQLDEKYSGTKTYCSIDLNESSYIVQNPLKNIFNNLSFDRTERTQQLEFDFPFYYNVNTIIKIPEGYTIEIPSDFNFETEFDNKKLYYIQKAEIKDGNLVYSTAFYMGKSIFSSFYSQIKTFFEKSNLAASKNILLKKI